MSITSFVGATTIQPLVGASVTAKLAVLNAAKCSNSVVGDDVKLTSGLLHSVFGVTNLAIHDVVSPTSFVGILRCASNDNTKVCSFIDQP